MSEWKTVRIGDLAEVFDGPHATPTKTVDGPWFLSISSLSGGRLNLAESAHLSQDDFAKWTRRITPQEGDVLFSYETRLGEAATMPAGLEACLGRRMGLLRPRGEKVDPRFLLYSYISPRFQRVIKERSIHGATVDRIPLTELPNWPITVPSLREQRAIGAVLGTLDDKVALNERIVERADELRRLLFEEFIAGDDVEKRPLIAFADFVNGRAFTKGATGTGRMVVRIAEINSGPGGSTVYNDIDVSDQHLARPGDVLFAWSGSLTVARWYRQEAIINQHIFKVIPKTGVPTWLAYELVLSKLADFKSIAAGKATTMGHIQRRHLAEPVTAPTADSIGRLHDQLGPLWDRALAAEQESLALIEMRDALLPGLMSGAIQVRDAERAVEDAI